MADWELLAREMRERALLIEGNEGLSQDALRGVKLKKAKAEQLRRVEEFKKLYFNAGRFAGGAKDHVAREAFYKYNEIQRNEDR